MSALVVQRTILRRRVAHALEHRLQHQRFKLLRHLLQTGLRVLLELEAKIGGRPCIEDKAVGVEVFSFRELNTSNYRA